MTTGSAVAMTGGRERKEGSAPGRVLAIDLGDRRIGVARSDLERKVALPLEVIARSGDVEDDHRRIAALVDEWSATTVVVGLPIGLNGRRGPAATKALAEVEELQAAVAVPVETWDERLSTTEVLAHRRRALQERDRSRREGRGGRAAGRGRVVVDDLAAAVVLQGWLDAKRGMEARS